MGNSNFNESRPTSFARITEDACGRSSKRLLKRRSGRDEGELVVSHGRSGVARRKRCRLTCTSYNDL